MLELRSVCGSYGQIQAVRDIDLVVQEGEAVALLGRNGTGKSTILKLIAGVLQPSLGEVIWEGAAVGSLAPERRVRLGIVLVPEGRGMFPALTIEENLRAGAYWLRPQRKALAEKMGEVYDLMPLIAARRRQTAGSLSGGEQQVLAIGRALMSEPKLLLLDEPSLGLAPKVVDMLYGLLGELVDRHISLVLVEQYAHMAERICRRAVVLDKGRVAMQGPAADLVQRVEDIYMGRGSAKG